MSDYKTQTSTTQTQYQRLGRPMVTLAETDEECDHVCHEVWGESRRRRMGMRPIDLVWEFCP